MNCPNCGKQMFSKYRDGGSVLICRNCPVTGKDFEMKNPSWLGRLQPQIPAPVECTHRRVKVGAYTDYWSSDCGRHYGISGPIEVGMGFNPDPKGNFCSNCGKKLKVDRNGLFKRET